MAVAQHATRYIMLQEVALGGMEEGMGWTMSDGVHGRMGGFSRLGPPLDLEVVETMTDGGKTIGFLLLA